METFYAFCHFNFKTLVFNVIDLRLEFISILNLTLAVNIFVKYKCKNKILPPQFFIIIFLKNKKRGCLSDPTQP
jgi:hypothetical protein